MTFIDVQDVGGVPWYNAPLPRRWHRCRRQTYGWIGMDYVERCACGAMRLSGRGGWMDKNERRKSHVRKVGRR